MKRLIIFLFIFIIVAQNYANNIKISLDLGGNKFQYLENVFAKVVLINYGSEPVEISKSYTSGPHVNFTLMDEQLNIYPNRMVDDFDLGKYYRVNPNSRVEFPLNAFYNLQYYMPGLEGIIYPLLNPGKYRIKAIIHVEGTVVESEWVEFEILQVQYTGIEEFRNVKIEFGMGADELKNNRKIIEDKYLQILKDYPVSMMTLRVILNLKYLYDFNFPGSESEYVYSKYLFLLERATKIQQEVYPNSRFAFFVVRRLVSSLSINKMKKFSFDYNGFYDDFYSKVTNPDLKIISQLRKNDFKQPGVVIVERAD